MALTRQIRGFARVPPLLLSVAIVILHIRKEPKAAIQIEVSLLTSGVIGKRGSYHADHTQLSRPTDHMCTRRSSKRSLVLRLESTEYYGAQG